MSEVPDAQPTAEIESAVSKPTPPLARRLLALIVGVIALLSTVGVWLVGLATIVYRLAGWNS